MPTINAGIDIYFLEGGGGGSLVFTPVHFAVKERISVYCVT